jgi:hypothetical protein
MSLLSRFLPTTQKEVLAMDILPGDVLEMKKEHPCGSRRWSVLRVGMDFRLRCQGCGREVMLPRKKAEKALKKILRPADPE